MTALKSSNVESTKEIITMARKGRHKFIHFVSTIGIFAPEVLSDPISFLHAVEPEVSTESKSI